MEDRRARTSRNPTAIRDRSRLKHACDAGVLSSADTPETIDLDDGRLGSGSDSCESTDNSAPLADLSAGLRVFSDWILRMQLSETEMIKAMEASRCEAEKRRAESEAECTRMLQRTQLQIASFVAGESKKRKRTEEDGLRGSSKRRGALLLSLLQCDLDLLNK